MHVRNQQLQRSAQQRALTAALLVGPGLLWLTGCNGADRNSAPAESSTPTKSAPQTSVSAGPARPDTSLAIGDRAVVRFPTDRTHRSRLAVTVTKVARGRLKDLDQFDLDRKSNNSSVYYATVKVRKLSGSDVSGEPVTLYGAISETVVVPPVTFGSTFKRCDYQPLPPQFANGDKTTLCMVMFAPRRGKISEIQWRPADSSDPTSWRVR